MEQENCLTPLRNVIDNYVGVKPLLRKVHGRYVFTDYGFESEKLFHCGASAKDGGNKVTTIMQIECPEMYRPLMEDIRKRLSRKTT